MLLARSMGDASGETEPPRKQWAAGPQISALSPQSLVMEALVERIECDVHLFENA
jgi:hypothetical protein